MIPSPDILNRFIEDTCVLATVAYMIARGAIGRRLFEPGSSFRSKLMVAVVFGVVGASESVFPRDRYPYVPYTLFTAIAAYAGGLELGLMTAMVVIVLATVVDITGLGAPNIWKYMWTTVAAAGGGKLVRMAATIHAPVQSDEPAAFRRFLVGACLAGLVGELPHAVFRAIHGTPLLPRYAFVYGMLSNAFGCFLVGIVLWDADRRRIEAQRALDTHREIADLRLSQLAQLQARLHPHFLFNALASIAGLCVTNPMRAEQGVTKLAGLLRQLLRAPDDVYVPLSDELALVRTYLAIEQLRFDERLAVCEDLAPDTLGMLVPRFALQVPVENAVQHGVARVSSSGTVTITSRRRKDRLVLAIGDEVEAGTAPVRRQTRDRKEPVDGPHGLEMLSARLTLAYGEDGRVRLFRRKRGGSLCVLHLPVRSKSG